MTRHSCFLAVAWLSMLASSLHAGTWMVGQSGDEDFSTLYDACGAASSGDTILISPGYYDEWDNLIVVNAKTLRIIGLGAGSDDTCFRMRLSLRNCDDSLIENICMRDSWAPLSIRLGTATIRNCTVRNCTSTPAVLVTDYSRLVVEDCIFADNGPEFPDMGDGGALAYAGLTVRRSLFLGNKAGGDGGAIFAVGSGLIEDCVFFRNEAPHGAAVCIDDEVQLHGCTFLSNRVTSVGESGGAIEAYWGGLAAPIRNCIIAGTVNGYGVECPGGGTLYCCDLWANDLGGTWGDWHCDALEMNGNFSADPLFCDPETGDVGLREGSPCLPGNHGGMDCELIGARGPGCGDVPVQEITWGRVKAGFR